MATFSPPQNKSFLGVSLNRGMLGNGLKPHQHRIETCASFLAERGGRFSKVDVIRGYHEEAQWP